MHSKKMSFLILHMTQTDGIIGFLYTKEVV